MLFALSYVPLAILAFAGISKLFAVYAGSFFPLTMHAIGLDGAPLYAVLGAVELLLVLLCLRSSLALSLIIQSVFYLLALLTSLLLLVKGAESCGCFGSIIVAPKITVILNFCVLLALILLQYRLKTTKQSSIDSEGSMSLKLNAESFGCMIAIAFVAIFALTSRYYRDSVQYVKADQVSVEGISVGQERDIRLRLHNSSNHVAEIIGAEKSCNCLMLDYDRIQIPPFGHNDLTVKFRPNQVGKSEQKLKLFLSHPSQHWLTVDIQCFVSGG